MLFRSCLVFLTVIRDGLVSFGAGLTKPDDKESRGFGFVASVVPVRVGPKGRESSRFEGVAPTIELRFPGPKLCRPREATEDETESVFCWGIDSLLEIDTEDILDDARLMVGDGMPSPSSIPR